VNNRGKALVVDDEPHILEFCQRVLESEGFAVQASQLGREGLAHIERERYELIVTDIKLPDLDGLQLLRRAREIDPHATVMVITGYGTAKLAIQALQLGAQGFLVKPFVAAELLEAVRETLQKQRLLRESLRLKALMPLLETNQVLMTGLSPDVLASLILEIVARETAADQAHLFLRDETGNPYMLLSLDFAGSAAGKRIVTGPGGAINQAVETGQPLFLRDGRELEQLSPAQSPPEATHALCMPLAVRDKVIGVLALSRPVEHLPFGRDELDLLSLLCGQVAASLHNATLFHQLSTMKQLNERILENMSNGIMVIGCNDELLMVNRALQKMAASKGIDLRQFHSLQGSTILEPLYSLFRETIENETPQPFREVALLTADGQHFPLRVSTSLLKDDQGQLSGVVGVVEDLSQLKALEEERVRLDRLSALGEMAARLAHEIRNPLTAIRMGVDCLADHLEAADQEQAESLRRILEEVQRLDRVVEDTLLFARPRRPELQPHDLRHIVNRALALHRKSLANRGVELITEWPTELPKVLADSVQMEQVVSNLILNALQAMPDGGRLKLSAALAPPDRVDLLVSDSGVGIASEDRDKIFEPFFSRKPYGTGLGLAIAKQTLLEHGSDILVESEPGHGATFTVRLPLAKRQ
jgi:PAS domain S-box-containing protein